MRPRLPTPNTRPEPAAERLLDARRVAEIFGRTLRSLSNWERRGLLIPIRHAGLRYYRESEVTALWMKSLNINLDQ